jgi:hypothetical protein
MPPIPPRAPVRFGLPGRASAQGFDVFVRRRGLFERVTAAPLSREQAKQFGAFVTGTTAAATFKLRPVAGAPTGVFAGRGRLEQFDLRTDRRTGFQLFIEKPRFRISTPGEVREISRRGQMVSRQRGAARRLRGAFGKMKLRSVF